MNAIIAYGTGRGTTAKIADAVAEGMKSAGVRALAVRIEFLTPARVAAADLFGIGSPVHFYREARYITRFLSTLPDLTGKPSFVFCTCGMDRPGETLSRLHGALAQRGAKVVGAQFFRSAMSYFPHRKRGLGNPDSLPDETVFAAAREFGARMTQAAHLSPIDPSPVTTVARLKARLLANMKFRGLVFPGIRMNRALCTGYGSCLSRCLIEGLNRVEGESIPYFTDTCVHCLECIAWCPRAAIDVDSPFKEWVSTLSYRLGIH